MSPVMVIGRLRRMAALAAVAALAATTATVGGSPMAAAVTPAAGTAPIILPDGRGLSPAGSMVSAGDFPAGGLPVPGYGVVVADTGTQPNNLLTVDPGTGLVLDSTVPRGTVSAKAQPDAQSAHLALSPDGRTLYAAGGATGSVEVFSVPAAGPLVQTSTLVVPIPPGSSSYIGGLAASSDGLTLYVTFPFGSGINGKGSALEAVPLAGGAPVVTTVGDHPLDVVWVAVAGRKLVVTADRASDQLSVVDPSTMTRLRTIAVGRQPAAPTLTADGHLLVVSTQDDTLTEVDPLTGAVAATVSLAAQAGHLGASPSALALSADGTRVYVATSADNALAVVGRSSSGLSLLGQVPTGAYPTSVALDPVSGALLVATGKGVGGGPVSPIGAPVLSLQPTTDSTTDVGVGGTVEHIAVPDDATLAADTALVARNNKVASQTVRSCTTPVPAIRHVVYVVRENKTYDEEFGDLPGGAPALAMYPRAITPNAHALAERFGLLQNFNSVEERSDTGHQAVMGSVANDWVQRLTQQSYGLHGAPRQGSELGNNDHTLWSAANYLFDEALVAGTSFRDYGEFYRTNQATGDSQAVSPQLDSHIVHGFPGFGFSPDVPDTTRINYWQKDFANDVTNGTFPSLEVVYLPEDHTTTGLTSTPQAQVADADLALGRLVDSLSHSPYWDSTAMVMTEDDPQSGQDHIDAHRTIGLVVSPWTRQGLQTNAHLDQTGMLRTVERLAGLPALTEHDASSTGFDDLFATTPTDTPYNALTPTAPALPPAATSRLRTVAASAVPSGRAVDATAAAQLSVGWYAARGAPEKVAALPAVVADPNGLGAGSGAVATVGSSGPGVVAIDPCASGPPPANVPEVRAALWLAAVTAAVAGLWVAGSRRRRRPRVA